MDKASRIWGINTLVCFVIDQTLLSVWVSSHNNWIGAFYFLFALLLGVCAGMFLHAYREIYERLDVHSTWLKIHSVDLLSMKEKLIKITGTKSDENIDQKNGINFYDCKRAPPIC